MKSFAKLSGALLVLASIPAFPATSKACSPVPPGLSSSLPASGDTYPAGAALVFYGYSISLDGVTVKVDGQPATLAPAPDIDALGFAALAARVMPPPLPGQKVSIAGDFCPPGNGCKPVDITFTAGAADTAAPAPPQSISFNLYDYPDFKSSGGDCQSDSDMGWFIDVGTAAPAPADSPVALKVEAFRDETFKEVVFSASTLVSSDLTSRGFRLTKSALAGADAPKAFCFRASLLDLAGNAATSTVHACAPCNYRKDPEGESSSPPAEPTWTAADIYPGGPCDKGTGGAGGAGGTGGNGGSGGSGATGGSSGNDAVKGCACRLAETPSSSDAPASLALVALAAMVGWRRARRRTPRV